MDAKKDISEAYATGRGSFRIRARFHAADAKDAADRDAGIERLSGGAWQLVITEIPYQVQKGKLIEQIADVIANKKLPILADVRDESDENIRIVLEPKSRNINPDDIKNALFRLTALESRQSLNLNVLDDTNTPSVMGIKPLLHHWIRHQIIILVNRTQHRLDKIDARLELLDGYIIAYLNLDRVIEIIRYEDHPKAVMMDEFSLTDRQAEAILNMRLRSLRKLEEMELRREHEALLKEKEGLLKLLESKARQKSKLKKNLADLRKLYAEDTAIGKRRTVLEEAGQALEIPLEAMIEKEPVTVIMSQRGWVKAMKGHVDIDNKDEISKFKDGDGAAFVFHAQTTDRLIMACDDGRFYTVLADSLPGARGFGEPVRSMVDMEANADIIAMMPYDEKARLLVAASNGRGFQVDMTNITAETRKGRRVVNLKKGSKLQSVRLIDAQDDHVAVIGDNRKMVVFAIADLPNMAKGQGVMLQRYKDGGMADVTTFNLEVGLSWPMGGDSGRTRTEKDINMWKVARGAAGRLPPNGFPRTNKFGE